MNKYEVIKNPIVTERSEELAKQNKYIFSVSVVSNKVEIRRSIESIYNVKVVKINTLWIRRKKKRNRYGYGKTALRKKAIVTLQDGYKIELV